MKTLKIIGFLVVSFILFSNAYAAVCTRYNRGMECIEWARYHSTGHCLQYNRAMKCIKWIGGTKYTVQNGVYCTKTRLGEVIYLNMLESFSHFYQEIKITTGNFNCKNSFWQHTRGYNVEIGANCRNFDLFAYGKYIDGQFIFILNKEELIFSKTNCKKW